MTNFQKQNTCYDTMHRKLKYNAQTKCIDIRAHSHDANVNVIHASNSAIHKLVSSLWETLIYVLISTLHN